MSEAPKQESSDAKGPRKMFTCAKCGLTAPYDYYGTRPPFAPRGITLLERAWSAKNPFAADNGKDTTLLVLGSKCSSCAQPVCQGCSMFYTRRFCKDCMARNITEFPPEIQQALEGTRGAKT